MLADLYDLICTIDRTVYITGSISTTVVILIAYLTYKLYMPSDLLADMSSKQWNPRQLDRYSEDELPLPQPFGWFAVFDSWTLKPNEAKPVSLFEHQLIVYRNMSGLVHVLEICENSNSIPDIETRVWQSMEMDNLIMVWYHPNNQKPDWLPFPMKLMVDNTFEYRGKCNLIANCCIQEFPENAADFAHFNTVHLPTEVLGIVKWKGMGAKLWDWITKHVYYKWTPLSYDVYPSPNGHMSIQITSATYHAFGRIFAEFTIDMLQIGPALAHVTTKYTLFGMDFTTILVTTVTPLGPYRNSFCHRLYMKPGFLRRVFAKIFIKTVDIMLSRDVLIWNDKKYLRKPLFTKNENSLVKFRRWYKQFLINDHDD
ncbi:cholesterol 7-desaturase nvd-like [Oppia nitens]|uniref:cholesterol 7-desaturase nvd-like n=1 Tax=Oppia nitens TaxID=1686743 RepID=UPI0023DCA4BB|nr:cholesterol 7-desaturase nvd-like [Oppia nitens]